MPSPKDIPEKIFTYGFSGSGWGRRRHSLTGIKSLYLVFNAEPKKLETHNLLRLPEVQALFPSKRFGIQLEDNKYVITDDIDALTPGFTGEVNQRLPAIIDGVFQILEPKKIQDACTLPHKLILGCSECLTEADNPELHCLVKKMFLEEPNLNDARFSVRQWKHLKYKIGDYTFVSPTYTASVSNFAAREQRVNNIDFDNIPENIKARKEAAQARGKVAVFRNTECARCLVRRYCDSAKWCSGPYDKTEKEYTQQILENTTVPFTNAQIRYLLTNSGELDKRYDRKKSYLSFRYSEGELKFILGHTVTGGETPLSFKAAKKIISEYMTPSTCKFPITKKLKAQLITLATLTSSPTFSNGWHSTHYPVRYIEYRYQELRLSFYQPSQSRIAPWVFTADDLPRFFSHYKHIPFVSKTTSPLKTSRSY